VANEDLRTEAKMAGVKLWQIAAKLGVSEATITRRMRMELPEQMKIKIRLAIHELSSDMAKIV